MARQAVAAIEALRVHAVVMAHQTRQVGLAGVQYQVEAIADQAIGQQLSVETIHGLSHHCQVHAPIVVTAVDGLATVSARGDPVSRLGEFNAKGAGRGKGLC